MNKRGANGECVLTEFHKSDYITHHDDFRAACVIARDSAENAGAAAYWDKQLQTLDRLESDYNISELPPPRTDEAKTAAQNRLDKPAKWWQFWLPQSGFAGGVLMGAYIAAILYVFWRPLC